MAQNFRHTEIAGIARRAGKVTTEGLAEHFGVTLQTIRRDLAELAEAGVLERVHGGAVMPSSTANIGYEDRLWLNPDGKRAIARAVAAALPSGAALFLNIGTTTEAVAEALAAHRDLMVVTNNMNVARTLAGHDSARVILTGGTLRRSDGGLIGPLASETIAQFKFDIAVIGCSGIERDGDITDFDLDEVGVSQAIIRQSRRVFVVADHSKIDRAAPARIASLADVDAVFTDRPLPGALAAACAGWGTEVVVASA